MIAKCIILLRFRAIQTAAVDRRVPATQIADLDTVVSRIVTPVAAMIAARPTKTEPSVPMTQARSVCSDLAAWLERGNRRSTAILLLIFRLGVVA